MHFNRMHEIIVYVRIMSAIRSYYDGRSVLDVAEVPQPGDREVGDRRGRIAPAVAHGAGT